MVQKSSCWRVAGTGLPSEWGGCAWKPNHIADEDATPRAIAERHGLDVDQLDMEFSNYNAEEPGDGAAARK